MYNVYSVQCTVYSVHCNLTYIHDTVLIYCGFQGAHYIIQESLSETERFSDMGSTFRERSGRLKVSKIFETDLSTMVVIALFRKLANSIQQLKCFVKKMDVA